MQNGTTGDKANIGTLSGKGAFLLDTDIAADTADSVFAKTGSGADYGILVKNSGDAPDRERMTQYLVKTADSGGTFSLLNRGGLVEAGIWAYSLASENVADGKQWYLERAGLVPEDPEPTPDEKPNAPAPNPGTGSDKPTPAPDPGTEPDEPAPAPDAPITADELSSTAQAALGSIVSPFIWYIEVDSLYKRIDEYTPDYEGGAWFRAFGKKEYYDNGLVDGVKQEYGGMSAGYDWVKAYDDGAKLYYGFMLGYGEGEREISFGSNDFDSKHFSLYGIYKKPNKFYVAGILKYNRYGSDFDLTESAYRRVEGDFDQNGYGASVQVGREFSLGNGWFWEPQLQFSVLRIEGDSYRTSGSPNAIIDVDMGCACAAASCSDARLSTTTARSSAATSRPRFSTNLTKRRISGSTGVFSSQTSQARGEATAWGSSTGRSTVSRSSSISNTAAAKSASSRGPCSSATE